VAEWRRPEVVERKEACARELIRSRRTSSRQAERSQATRCDSEFIVLSGMSGLYSRIRKNRESLEGEEKKV